MPHFLYYYRFALAFAFAAPLALPNLLVNGGFESGAILAGSAQNSYGALSGWAVLPAAPNATVIPSAGVYIYSTGYVENNMGGNGFVEFQSFEGNQHVDLTSWSSGSHLALVQDVNVVDGAEYSLSLALGNASGTYTTDGGELVDQYSEASRLRIVITSGDEVIYDEIFENALENQGAISWTQVALKFRAKGSKIRIHLMAADPTDEYVGVDNVVLEGPPGAARSPGTAEPPGITDAPETDMLVPEGSTSILVGLGLISVFFLRKKPKRC